jgi:chromate transporter
MSTLVQLFWLFIKVNLLTTSGPASVGLLYKESVGILMTNADFVQAVSFSSILPGSDALQLAMFIGYSVAGFSGALVALLGSILPPTLLILGLISILNRLRRQAWITRFVSGLTPAVSILMIFVAWQVFRASNNDTIGWQSLLIAGGTLAGLLLELPVPLILLAAGLLGVFIF